MFFKGCKSLELLFIFGLSFQHTMGKLNIKFAFRNIISKPYLCSRPLSKLEISGQNKKFYLAPLHKTRQDRSVVWGKVYFSFVFIFFSGSGGYSLLQTRAVEKCVLLLTALLKEVPLKLCAPPAPYSCFHNFPVVFHCSVFISNRA